MHARGRMGKDAPHAAPNCSEAKSHDPTREGRACRGRAPWSQHTVTGPCTRSTRAAHGAWRRRAPRTESRPTTPRAGAARVLRAPTRRMPTRTVPKRNRAPPHGRDALPRVRAALARPPPQLGERGRTRAGRLGKHPATAHGHRCRRGTSAVRSARRFTSNNQTATSSPATSILVREYVNKRSTSRTPAKACPSPRHAAATTSTAAEAVWTLNTTTLMYNE